MKGLLIKDLALCSINKLVYIVGVVVLIFSLIIGGDSSDFISSFVTTYIAVISSLTVINTISYDDVDDGMAYVMTLPVTKTQYVIEKYVLLLAVALSSTVITVSVLVISTLKERGIIDSLVIMTPIMSNIIVFTGMSTIIPMQIKYGSEKGRIRLFAVYAIVALICFGSYKLLDMAGVDVDNILYNILEFVANFETALNVGLIFIVGAVITIFITMLISIRIINKKEF